MSWPGLSRPHVLLILAVKTWMPATSAGMTEGRASALLVCYLSQIFSGTGARAGQFMVPE
jgi:hypothetical protein